MNKIIQKVSIVALVLMTLVSVVPAQTVAIEQATFNTDPRDYPVLETSNYTQNPGCSTCWSSSTTANPGDTVSFEFFYHNTSNVTAHFSRASISFANQGNRVVATGRIWAQNASAVTGTVTINAAPGTTIAINSGTQEYGIGEVYADDSNFLVVRFQVAGSAVTPTPTPTLAPTVNLTSNRTQVNRGETVILSWTSTRATECHPLAGAGFTTNGLTSGSDQVYPLDGTTTFSIECTGPGGNARSAVTVYVTAAPTPTPTRTPYPTPTRTPYPTPTRTPYPTPTPTPILPPTASISADRTQVTNGASVILSWSSTRATSCQALAGSGFETHGLTSGFDQSFPLYNTTTFTVGCSGSGGSTLASVTVSVTNYPTPTPTITPTPTYTPTPTPGIAPIAVTDPATQITQTSAMLNGRVNPNGRLTQTWFEYGTSPSLGQQTSTYAITESPYVTDGFAQIGRSVFGLNTNTTYYFRTVAQNDRGISYGSILSFTTGLDNQGNAPEVETMYASNITRNFATLNGEVDPNSLQTIYWFEYGTSYSLGESTSHQTLYATDGFVRVSRSISNLDNDETYYYRVVASNQYGTDYGSIVSFQTNENGDDEDLIVETLYATNIDNEEATLRGTVEAVNDDASNVRVWFEYGTDDNDLDDETSTQYLGTINEDDQEEFSRTIDNLSSGRRYYYRAVAQSNESGTVYGNIRNFVADGDSDDEGDEPYAITNPASNVSRTSALINGQVNPNGAYATSWFEYGTSYGNLVYRTASQSMGSGDNLIPTAAALTGLSSNTTYYFRVVAENSEGTAYGSILNFRTEGGGIIYPTPTPTTYPPVVITTGGTGLSCVLLVPSINMAPLQEGQEFTYTITYRNGCNYNLSNVFLKVIMPTETEFIATNYPFFNIDANGISYNLGALPPNFQSAISIQGRVRNNVATGSTLIFSSVLNFNDAQGRFQSVSAYLTALVGGGMVLSASIFDAFNSLLGNWLFWLLFILLIIFLIWWLFFGRRREVVERVDVLRE